MKTTPITPGAISAANNLRNCLSDSIAPVVKYLPLYVTKPGACSRTDRNLVTEYTKCMIGMKGGSIATELASFFGVSEDTPTIAAFTNWRYKIIPEFFEDISNSFVDATAPLTRRFHDCPLFAFDGTDFAYFPHPDEEDFYFPTKDDAKDYNMLHVDAMYDVATGIYHRLLVCGAHVKNEPRAAITMINESPIERAIVTADRNYATYNLIVTTHNKGWNYLIRAKDKDSNGIISGLQIPDTPEFDIDVHITLTNKKNQESQELQEQLEGKRLVKYINGKYLDLFPDYSSRTDPMMTYDLDLRIVRIEVAPGQYQILMTNLSRDEFPPKELKALYRKRWKIEISFRQLKDNLEFSAIHSTKTVGVIQELYAHAIMYNFTKLLGLCAEPEECDKKCHKAAYERIINFNRAATAARSFLRGDASARDILLYMQRDMVPIRDNRSYPRNKRPRRPPSFVDRPAGAG